MFRYPDVVSAEVCGAIWTAARSLSRSRKRAKNAALSVLCHTYSLRSTTYGSRRHVVATCRTLGRRNYLTPCGLPFHLTRKQFRTPTIPTRHCALVLSIITRAWASLSATVYCMWVTALSFLVSTNFGKKCLPWHTTLSAILELRSLMLSYVQATYWPHMRKNLECLYITSCKHCQRNKSSTKKLSGPLHPLPVPDERCQSVAIDFVSRTP